MEFYCFAIKMRIKHEETRGGKIRKVKGKKSVLKKVPTVGYCGDRGCRGQCGGLG